MQQIHTNTESISLVIILHAVITPSRTPKSEVDLVCGNVTKLFSRFVHMFTSIFYVSSMFHLAAGPISPKGQVKVD